MFVSLCVGVVHMFVFAVSFLCFVVHACVLDRMVARLSLSEFVAVLA